MAADDGSNEKDNKKRRLQLMPEVLPDPKKAGGSGSARQRTMKTMERLIAVSAASALIAGCESTGGAGPGYGVVDPMPPPSQCPNIASSITAKATWKLENNQLVVLLELGVPGKSDATYLDVDPPGLSGASLVRRTLNQGALAITVLPSSGVTGVSISVPIRCAAGDASANIMINLGNVTPADGAQVSVTVYDGY